MNHLKLVQETQIAALQQAYIVNGIAHHRQAREAKAECKSIPLFGIETGVADHVGMHQSARQQLHPSALLAHGAAIAAADQALDIELKAGFHKREVAGTQPHRNFATEDRAEQSLHEVNQVRDGNV